MKYVDNIVIKISILDHNIFITEAIEEILKDYPCQIRKIKSLVDISDFCDYLIFYEESVNDKLIEEIISLPKFVQNKVLICNKDFRVPTRLLELLHHIINIKELDFHLKELMDYYILIHSEKTNEEMIELIKKLMNDSSQYISSLLVYSEALRNSLVKAKDSDIELLKKYERILRDFEKEFLSFQNFMFVTKLPLNYEDISILIQNILREREYDLKSKIGELIFLPAYTLPMIKINPVVIKKIFNNIIDLVLISALDIKVIEVSIRDYKNYLKINFEVICSEFDTTLRQQIYNPFFPRSVLENSFINYFRIKIEKFLKMTICDFFDENKISFIIKIEIGD